MSDFGLCVADLSGNCAGNFRRGVRSDVMFETGIQCFEFPAVYV